MKFEPSYYNRTHVLSKSVNAIIDFAFKKCTGVAPILSHLFSLILNIPSGHSLTLSTDSDVNKIKFLWINKESLYSLWTISLTPQGTYNAQVEIISNYYNRTINFNIDNKSSIPEEIINIIKMDFSLNDTDFETLDFKHLKLSDYIVLESLERPYNILNNSPLKSYKEQLLSDVKSIESYDVITFEYYDGPLTGVHLIDGDFYLYFINGYVNAWFNTHSISSVKKITNEKHILALKYWLKTIDEQGTIYEDSKTQLKIHSFGKIDTDALFLHDEDKSKEAKIIFKEIEQEHDNLSNNKNFDFYIMY